MSERGSVRAPARVCVCVRGVAGVNKTGRTEGEARNAERFENGCEGLGMVTVVSYASGVVTGGVQV